LKGKNMSRCTRCSAGILCECDKKTKDTESVNHPDHYLKDSGHEVIDVIRAWKLNFELGNAVKYIARAGRKNPEKTIEDLQKAIWYINEEIEQIK
tara:strand:- start:229 stop:513 length:285 start_codon:yes stop_codon:yes gene_type:complete